VSSGAGGAGGHAATPDIPDLPQAFYGAVTINGVAAPSDAMAEARDTGVLTGVWDNPIAVSPAGLLLMGDRVRSTPN
jgi:hypothetical protein